MIDGLRLPHEFYDDSLRISVYGFAGEPTAVDPWGNPYVLQIPPAQAFLSPSNVTDEVRFRYARLVSAGPDGCLDTPCFESNGTNDWQSAGADWCNPTFRRLIRQAGRIAEDVSRRGDDVILFMMRSDVDDGEEED